MLTLIGGSAYMLGNNAIGIASMLAYGLLEAAQVLSFETVAGAFGIPALIGFDFTLTIGTANMAVGSIETTFDKVFSQLGSNTYAGPYGRSRQSIPVERATTAQSSGNPFSSSVGSAYATKTYIVYMYEYAMDGSVTVTAITISEYSDGTKSIVGTNTTTSPPDTSGEAASSGGGAAGSGGGDVSGVPPKEEKD
jgi:hypothetical protein